MGWDDEAAKVSIFQVTQALEKKVVRSAGFPFVACARGVFSASSVPAVRR